MVEDPQTMEKDIKHLVRFGVVRSCGVPRGIPPVGSQSDPKFFLLQSEHEEEEEFQRQLDQALKISLSDMGQPKVLSGQNVTKNFSGSGQRSELLPTRSFETIAYPGNGPTVRNA